MHAFEMHSLRQYVMHAFKMHSLRQTGTSRTVLAMILGRDSQLLVTAESLHVTGFVFCVGSLNGGPYIRVRFRGVEDLCLILDPYVILHHLQHVIEGERERLAIVPVWSSRKFSGFHL